LKKLCSSKRWAEFFAVVIGINREVLINLAAESAEFIVKGMWFAE